MNDPLTYELIPCFLATFARPLRPSPRTNHNFIIPVWAGALIRASEGNPLPVLYFLRNHDLFKKLLAFPYFQISSQCRGEHVQGTE